MRTIAITTAALLLSSSALAQTGPNSQPQQNQNLPAAPSQAQAPQQAPQQGPQSTAKIAQQIRSNLKQAGFKNIQLMPSSFIVRAEDQNNNPVMMVINPDSVMAVSETNKASGGNDQNTVGQVPGSSSTPESHTPPTQPGH